MSKIWTPEVSEEEKVADRRQFLKVAGTSGFTVAALAAAGSSLYSPAAVAQTRQEEEARQKAAKYTMTIASAYQLGASRSYPIMQLDFKENIQTRRRWRAG
jgi:hypothetical protein